MSPVDTLLRAISQHILNPLIYLAFAVAVAWFLYGGFQYIYKDAPTAKSEGRMNMFWGVIGLLIMLLAFTIIQIIGNTIKQPVPSF
jgi:uncharacterized membrane protein YjfL (UPF0719 family)